MTAGYFTKEEITSQSLVWQKTVEQFNTLWNDQKELSQLSLINQPAIVVGCGSTYYLSLSVASLLRQNGIPAQAVPASDFTLFTKASYTGNPWLLAISRSGSTSETLWAVNRFRENCSGGKVIAITVDPESDLAKYSDYLFAASDAQEKSVVQTRSFTSMFLLSQLLVASLCNDQYTISQIAYLPQRLDSLLAQVGDLPSIIGNDSNLHRFFFLGGGPFYGLACEATLKAKEMTLTWSEGYHPLEIRHGPKSVVNKNSLVVALMSDSGFEAERNVLSDMKKLGAKVMAITEDGSSIGNNEVDYLVDIQSGLTEWVRGPLYLPVLHWVFYHRALSQNLNPDKPLNLTQVVEIS